MLVERIHTLINVGLCYGKQLRRKSAPYWQDVIAIRNLYL